MIAGLRRVAAIVGQDERVDVLPERWIQTGNVRLCLDNLGGRYAHCRECRSAIWWFTLESGRRLAVDETLQVHFGRCPGKGKR